MMIPFGGERMIRISVQCWELLVNLRVVRAIIHTLSLKVDD